MLDAVDRFAKTANATSKGGITKEQYLLLCEVQGIEPDEKVIPLEMGDFPPIIESAMIIYNKLRDVYLPGDMPHFTGKDLSPLVMLFDIYEIYDAEERRFILDVITIFDHHAVSASKRRIEAENAKIKRKAPKS